MIYTQSLRSDTYFSECVFVEKKEVSLNYEKKGGMDMDNGASNQKSLPSYGTALKRSTINDNNDDYDDADGDDDNNNFTFTSNRAMRRHFSSIETNSNSGSGFSEISNLGNGPTSTAISDDDISGIRRNIITTTPNHRRQHEIDYRDSDERSGQRQHQFRQHRWTVNSSTEKLPTKSYVIDKNLGLSNHNFVSTNNINDSHSKNSNGDKAKWTHKTPIGGNTAV